MASDQVVTAQDVLRSLMELRRLGSQRVLQELEQQEGDLVEYLLEEMSGVHQDVLALGGKPGRSRRLVQRVEAMALVLVTALRQAHLRLWREDAADGGRLAQIDPSLAPGPPGAPADPDLPPPPPPSPRDDERDGSGDRGPGPTP